MNWERIKRRHRLRRANRKHGQNWLRLGRFVALFKILVFLCLLGGIGWGVDKIVPHQHLPWRALDADRPLGLATKTQLFRVQLSPSQTCVNIALSAQDLSSVPADPKTIKDSPCGWGVARVHYGSNAVPLSPGEATMQCPLSLGSYIWSREIDSHAQVHLGASLSKIVHAGTYSCRRQRGNGSGAWSEHAYANAFDVTGFILSDGRVISVLKDWDGDKDRRRFLRDVRDSACDIFRVTLSPDYNAAHKDHFHVDMGPSNACR